MMSANLEFLRALESIRNVFLDELMLIITEFGNEIVVLGVMCALYWCIDKRLAYKVGISFFVSGMLVQALKLTFHIERPWVLDPTLSPVERAKPAATGYSFPSGHTQCASALYGSFFISTRSAAKRAVCAVLVCLVAFSRLYLGVHTPLDVLTALAVSLACTYICCKLFDRLEGGNSQGKAVCVALGAISVAICLYSLVLERTGITASKQLNDCFKCGGAGVAFALGWYLERNKLRFSERTDKTWKQIVKLCVGVGVALALKSLPKIIAEGSLIVDFVRYFLTVMWVLVGFPWIFDRFSRKDEQAE